MDVNDVTKILSRMLPNGLPVSSATLIRRIEKPEADNVKNLN
jgi:stage V sporulation protein D (sporulation-specific penicillin-binding protein)